MMQQWAGVTTIDGVTGGRPIVRCRLRPRGASADPAPRQCRTYPTKIQLRCPAANLLANELYEPRGFLFILPNLVFFSPGMRGMLGLDKKYLITGLLDIVI